MIHPADLYYELAELVRNRTGKEELDGKVDQMLADAADLAVQVPRLFSVTVRLVCTPEPEEMTLTLIATTPKEAKAKTGFRLSKDWEIIECAEA